MPNLNDAGYARPSPPFSRTAAGFGGVDSGAQAFFLVEDIQDDLASFLFGRKFVSVTHSDHQATGDDSTDDTAAIEAARDAAGVGGIVFFPGGKTYRVDNLEASVASQYWMLSKSARLKLVASPTTAAKVLRVSAANVEIAGGTIDGGRGSDDWGGSGDVDHDGIFVISGGDNCRIHHQDHTGCSYSVRVSDGDHCIIEYCHSENSRNDAYKRLTGTNATTFYGFTVRHCIVDRTAEDPDGFRGGAISAAGEWLDGDHGNDTIIVGVNFHDNDIFFPADIINGTGVVPIEVKSNVFDFRITSNRINRGHIQISVSNTCWGIIADNICKEGETMCVELAGEDHDSTPARMSTESIVVVGNEFDSTQSGCDGINIQGVCGYSIGVNTYSNLENGISFYMTVAANQIKQGQVTGGVFKNVDTVLWYGGGTDIDYLEGVQVSNLVIVDCGQLVRSPGGTINVRNFKYHNWHVTNCTDATTWMALSNHIDGTVSFIDFFDIDEAGDASNDTATALNIDSTCSNIDVVHNYVKGFSGEGGKGIVTDDAATDIRRWGNRAPDAETDFAWGSGTTAIAA